MPTVRVLVVTDDWPFVANGGFLQWTAQANADAAGPNSRAFHLGEFLRVLTDTTWVGFTLEITKAHRNGATAPQTDAQFKADRGADLSNFRFDQPHTVNGENRTLASYDMVLFFPINALNPDAANATLATEAEAIAQYMEDGHGLFATGDHANLGSSLAGLIPRVRSMRRWWWPSAGPNGEPIAPDPLNADRHDTTQPGADGVRNFEDQSDEFAQPIEPAFYAAGLAVKGGYPATKSLPHMLLCSPNGVVKVLPDHMHEGWIEVPDNLAARTFTLGGNAVREYPDYGTNGPLAPEIVATGKVLAGTTSPALDPDDHTGGDIATNGITFGVIGAWDGQRVSKGRVVVDSTWHHFFNINLTGDRYLESLTLANSQKQKLHGFFIPDGMGGRKPSPDYEMIQWYFRNIVYWLIPANRHKSIWWYALAELARYPQFGEELATVRDYTAFKWGTYGYLSQLAEDYFKSARGACAVYHVREILYKPKIPWWEWIQDLVDPWDPALAGQGPREETLRAQHRGLAGIGPQPEVALQLGLGAAVIAAASVRREHGADTAKVEASIERRFDQVFTHAMRLYGDQLRKARDTQAKLEALIADTVKGHDKRTS